jgi:hypothetical protein
MLAQQLLDAQVRFHLDRLGDAQVAATVRAVADDLLDAAGRRPVRDLVDPADIAAVVTRSLATVPPSDAIAAIVEMAVDVALDTPRTPYPLGDVVPRERVEALLDALLAQTPALERTLDRLTTTPLVGVMATRFLARVATEVLETNRSVADKVLPGLGSLMSFGTTAASRVVGAADSQLQGLLGDTVGKGGSFAVGRLNKVLLETLRDPTTRAAVLQAWDQVAAQPLGGLGEQVDRDEVQSVVDAGRRLTVTVLAHEHVTRIAEAAVAAFFARFGDLTATELLDELGLARADLVDDVVALAPGIVAAARESGDLERIVRSQLEPFYASPEVIELLG